MFRNVGTRIMHSLDTLVSGHREPMTVIERKILVDTPDNRTLLTESDAKRALTEEILRNYSDKNNYKVSNVNGAVSSSMKLLKSAGWHAWKFKKSHAEVLRFGVILDWPQYDAHLTDQSDLLKKVCDKVAEVYHVQSCGKNTIVAGGAYAMYLGFK